MVYETFLETVKEILQNSLGEEFTLQIRQIPKNNGILLDGLCIGKIADQIAPTIYLNSYFEHYIQGMPMSEIIEDILELYQDNISLPNLNLEQLNQFQSLKDLVVFKLIHGESNKELLSDVPFLPYLDLAIVFYLFLDSNESGQMTALVHNDHQRIWDISTQELYRIAKNNTIKLLPAQIKNMTDVMKEIAKDNLGEDYREEFIDELLENDQLHSPLYVLSNQIGLNGSCCILYDSHLKNFADQICHDLIILPSSIHEVLITPYTPNVSYEELSQMVTSINQSEVPVEDQLSNQVYLYSRATDQLSIVSHSSAPIGTKNP